MYTIARRIYVANLQGQTFAQTQAHALHDEIEHFVAQSAGLLKLGLRLLDGDDVGQALTLGGLTRLGIINGFTSACSA